MPRVAIILINWNSGGRTATCLRSLAKLTYPSKRVIVVDNGSQDGSLEVLNDEFPDVEVVRNPTNLGFTGGMNAGLRRARGLGFDYYLMLNNDTIVAPDLLEILVSTAESDPRIAALNPKIYFMDRPDVIWHARGHYNWWTGITYSHAGETDHQDELEDVNFLSGCALMLRAAAVETIGVLDHRFFIYCEDIDYTTRVLAAGHRAVYVPSGRVWHLEHSDITHNAGRGFMMRWSTRNRLLLMQKHARNVQWVTFLPVFLVWYVAARLCAYLLRRQWDRMKGLIAGLGDFLHARTLPPQEGW